MNNKKSLLALIISMTVFGTVGIFSKAIPMPSGVIAFLRAVIGMLFLIAFSLIFKKKYDYKAIRKNIKWLIPSGIALGANWMLFFLSCKTTTVPTATLSYYLAPTFLVLLSALILKEKLSVKQYACVLTALLGMVLASGVIGKESGGVSVLGIAYGALAAVLYAFVVLFNKLMSDIDPISKTTVQFFISSIALIPYILIAEDVSFSAIEPLHILYTVIMGIVHTGACYVLYFGAVSKLNSSTVALYSYIDPIVSICVSTIFFSEPITVFVILGAFLIIGASLASEIDISKMLKNTKNENNSSQKDE